MSDQTQQPQLPEDEEDKQSDFIKFFVVIAVITAVLGAIVWWSQSRERDQQAVEIQQLSDGTRWGLVIDDNQECGPVKATFTGIVKVPTDPYEPLDVQYYAQGCHDAKKLHVFEDRGVWVTSHNGVLTACGPLFGVNFEVGVEACQRNRSYTYQEQRCSFHDELKSHFPSLNPVDLDPEACPRLTPITQQ
ncbi:MAG: hypothetical protein Alpg2KO_25250 [Alphaproteobacteria bacterium]